MNGQVIFDLFIILFQRHKYALVTSKGEHISYIFMLSSNVLIIKR